MLYCPFIIDNTCDRTPQTIQLATTKLSDAAPIASPEDSHLGTLPSLSSPTGDCVETVVTLGRRIDEPRRGGTDRRGTGVSCKLPARVISRRNSSGPDRCIPRPALPAATAMPRVQRNSKGESLLHRAAIRGDAQQVLQLLSGGGAALSPNLRDHAGWTALHEAVLRGHREVRPCLFALGCGVCSVSLCLCIPPLVSYGPLPSTIAHI